MKITFKKASSADKDCLLAFMREYYKLDHLALDEKRARSALAQILQDPSVGQVWLIQDQTEAVGYVALTLGFSLEYHGRDAFLDEIFIKESHRGRGIGRQALAFVEEQCRKLGVRALHLEVERTNLTAQKSYRKFGFVDHDRYLMTKPVAGRDSQGVHTEREQ